MEEKRARIYISLAKKDAPFLEDLKKLLNVTNPGDDSLPNQVKSYLKHRVQMAKEDGII